MPLTLDLTPIVDRIRREAEKHEDFLTAAALKVGRVPRTVEVEDDVVNRLPWLKELDAQRLAEGQAWYCGGWYALFDGRFTVAANYKPYYMFLGLGHATEARIKFEVRWNKIVMPYLALDIDVYRGELRRAKPEEVMISAAEAGAILMYLGVDPRLAATIMLAEWR